MVTKDIWVPQVLENEMIILYRLAMMSEKALHS